jgi:hypothetical protein
LTTRHSKAAQSAGANSFHTVFFTTKHFLSLWAYLCLLSSAGTKYFIFPMFAQISQNANEKRGGGAASRFVLIVQARAAHGSPLGLPQ